MTLRELWRAFRAMWVAADPSDENRADEALVRPALPRNDLHSRKADTPLWWLLAAECSAENGDAPSYATALLRAVGCDREIHERQAVRHGGDDLRSEGV